MDKGAYEIIKLLIQSVDQEIRLEFADGTSRTVSIDPDKLLAELDKDQKLEEEADWLADKCKDLCASNSYCAECALYPFSCPRGEFIGYRFTYNPITDWREVARQAVAE